eukprot:CAMPEP_0194765526 /NCGR_PEP_ID=MMETSP0323_2-20130528/26868_1 /TAXON_ID=2866 ORGANISM="Crypthecodinium cohnii, Strain Seligo" /NCGR_SAMPLE_ID=MMETSP0323_2 /ASSEMBLY_ACC=CAM_ASM_000346 /LENGTH=82 /DNA_ID=CAMNT_0039695249 /DNA_START=117 /DNA_END=365 /DNA_ORIENTATION=+
MTLATCKGELATSNHSQLVSHVDWGSASGLPKDTSCIHLIARAPWGQPACKRTLATATQHAAQSGEEGKEGVGGGAGDWRAG